MPRPFIPYSSLPPLGCSSHARALARPSSKDGALQALRALRACQVPVTQPITVCYTPNSKVVKIHRLPMADIRLTSRCIKNVIISYSPFLNHLYYLLKARIREGACEEPLRIRGVSRSPTRLLAAPTTDLLLPSPKTPCASIEASHSRQLRCWN